MPIVSRYPSTFLFPSDALFPSESLFPGGDNLITLEFSEDPVSDASPTYVDVSNYLKEAEWWAGVDNEGDEPTPGGAVFQLKNLNRDFEPDYTAGRFYPNVKTHRRFRWTVNGTLEGVFYITDLEIDYPAGTDYSEVTLTCADGMEVLGDLAGLDPPGAQSYPDVVGFDDPWGYWRLGEAEGTKTKPHIVYIRDTIIDRKHGKKIRRRYKRKRGVNYSTTATGASEAGPEGTYKNTPSLGQPGLLVGDPATAVKFERSNEEYVTVPGTEDDFEGGFRLTLECWVRFDRLGVEQYMICGPVTSGGDELFFLRLSSADNLQFGVKIAGTGAGTIATQSATGLGLTVGTVYHFCVTRDRNNTRFWVNGVLVRESDSFDSEAVAAPTTNERVRLARGPAGSYLDGTLQDVAIYEKALPDARVVAHYTAGASRGWDTQTAAARVAELVPPVTAFGGDLGVTPQLQTGQAVLEEISETMHAEGLRTMFFYEVGDPVYFGWDWRGAAAAFSTTQTTFGDGPGETPYDAVELVYDNEVFGVFVASREGGEELTVTDADSESEFGERTNPDLTGLILAADSDVQAVASEALDVYKDPAFRPKTVAVNGAKAHQAIFGRRIGDQVRIKRRGEGGTPIDRACNIIGWRKTLTADKNLFCEYALSRGFNASLADWHLGVGGFSELGTSTVLG